MTHILFFEKPGCRNNVRQKAIFERSGHAVEAVNLLEHAWSKEELEKYLGEKPVAEYFNPAAPAIKSGEISPLSFTREEAIALLIREPLLIKRPLIRIGSHYLQGFDTEVLKKLISIDPVQGTAAETATLLSVSDMNACPHSNNFSCIIKEN